MSVLGTYLAAGERIVLGSHHFDAAEIIDFGRKYDPQPFHVDAEAAKHSVFAGLCASGWHTTAMWMRKNVEMWRIKRQEWQEAGLPPVEFGPSPGLRNLRWLRPVYAGEDIAYFVTPVREKPIARRPGWLMLEHVGEAETADGKPVMRFESAVMLRPTS